MTTTISSFGLEILKSNLKGSIKKYVLFGDREDSDIDINPDTTYEDIQEKIFFTGYLERGYFDSEGFLTYEVSIRDVGEELILFGLMIVSEDNQAIATIKTQKIRLFDSVGLEFIIKLPITSQENQIIFSHNEYISKEQFEEFKKSKTIDINYLARQVLSLSLHIKEKVKREKKDYEQIGQISQFLTPLPSNWININEEIYQKDCLLLFSKLDIKKKSTVLKERIKGENLGNLGVYRGTL